MRRHQSLLIYLLLFTALPLLMVACSGDTTNTGKLRLLMDKIKGEQIIKVNDEVIDHGANQHDITLGLPAGKNKISVSILSEDGNWRFDDEVDVDIRSGDVTVELLNLKRKPTTQQIQVIAAEKAMLSQQNTAKKDNQRYIDNGDNTITDRATKLMWKKCAEGLAGIDCSEGVIRKLNWYDAQTHAQRSNFAGYNDWRVPNYVELRTLVKCPNGSRNLAFDDAGYLLSTDDIPNNGECLNKDNSEPAINPELFPNTPVKRYWTSSLLVDNPIFAWNIHFNQGSIYYDDVKNDNRFRLVREVTQ